MHLKALIECVDDLAEFLYNYLWKFLENRCAFLQKYDKDGLGNCIYDKTCTAGYIAISIGTPVYNWSWLYSLNFQRSLIYFIHITHQINKDNSMSLNIVKFYYTVCANSALLWGLKRQCFTIAIFSFLSYDHNKVLPHLEKFVFSVELSRTNLC